jgi:hypothetical protein
MDTVIKILLGGAVVFLVFGGPRLLNKGSQPPQSPPVVIGEPSLGTGRETVPAGKGDLSNTFVSGAPVTRISSMSWLRSNGNLVVEMQEANMTYYLLANSSRLHIDSVAACLKQAVLSRNIDPVDFQYTYFLDRVILAGSGFLIWDGKKYLTSYDRVRRAGWSSGSRRYSCSNFRYQAQNALTFIRQNISNESIFVPVEKARYPNGATASGQGAIDWVSLSVNARDFPLSVPDATRRTQLATRFAGEGKRKPAARSYVVIQTADGKLFLTEAMDTGSGVKPGWIDWRIGNTSTEIKYFRSLGRKVKAYGFTFDDPNMTYEKVLANSK